MTDAVDVDVSLDDLSGVSTERLEAAIGAGAARLAAMQCRWLLLLAEFVNRNGFERWEMSAQRWLSWRCSLDPVTAREHLRVAHALTQLPVVRTSFSEGRLSYSKVRAITRVATSDDEADWVATAISVPAATLARLAGRFRTVTAMEEEQRQQHRSLTWHWDDDGMLVVSGRMTTDEGAEFIAAIEGEEPNVNPQPVDSAGASGASDIPGRRIDALLQLVHDQRATPTGTEPLVAATQPEVVLHVSVGDLSADQPARRHLSNDQPVGPGAARRLACDPIVTALLHDRDGAVIDVGRRHRLVTARLRRAVYERDDSCCTYPGCTNTRWLDVHHVTHWEDGGRTDLDNLLLLCGTHHRAHHAGAFTITPAAGRHLFHTAHGAPITPSPALRVVPPPPDDLMRTPTTGLGPIEGTWDGWPIDRDWAVTCLAQNAARSVPGSRVVSEACRRLDPRRPEPRAPVRPPGH